MKIGDRIYVVVRKERAIVPAEVSKTYEGSSTIYWKPTAMASNGIWLTCGYRTANYFLSMNEAKGSLVKELKEEKEKIIKDFDAKISEIESFKEPTGKTNTEIVNNLI